MCTSDSTIFKKFLNNLYEKCHHVLLSTVKKKSRYLFVILVDNDDTTTKVIYDNRGNEITPYVIRIKNLRVAVEDMSFEMLTFPTIKKHFIAKGLNATIVKRLVFVNDFKDDFKQKESKEDSKEDFKQKESKEDSKEENTIEEEEEAAEEEYFDYIKIFDTSKFPHYSMLTGKYDDDIVACKSLSLLIENCDI